MNPDQPLPMNRAPRCLARNRQGKPCQSPAVKGKRRCRLHGEAEGSGAPKGNQNALKHGRYAGRAVRERERMAALLRDAKAFLAQLGKT